MIHFMADGKLSGKTAIVTGADRGLGRLLDGAKSSVPDQRHKHIRF